MRALSSLVVVVALGSCSAIDDYGKFTVGGGVDMGGGCMAGCDCIAGDAALGVPDHCRVGPLNAFNCTAVSSSRPVVTLAAGIYQLDTSAQPPVLNDSSGHAVMSGIDSGVTALFCIGSLVADQNVHINVVGNRPTAIIADSLIRMAMGSWTLAGAYATDMAGGSGVGGGSNGGATGNAGAGGGAGHGGTGSPGTGGGGGGAAAPGAMGGAAMGGSPTAGGAGAMPPLVGFGGGAGGQGSTFGGGGGGGGGALQLKRELGRPLRHVAVDASGGGGAGGGAAGSVAGMTAGGGGGGGGGGTIALDAPNVSVMGGCLSVAGGPGGAGGALTRGGDAHMATACGAGSGGIAPLNGGPGGAPGGSANGGAGTMNGGGGGGLGGAGRVTIRSHDPPTSGPGVVPMTAYVASIASLTHCAAP